MSFNGNFLLRRKLFLLRFRISNIQKSICRPQKYAILQLFFNLLIN